MQSTKEIKDQKLSMIANWQQSGLTQKQYCEQHQLRYHVFHYWYRRYREEQSHSPNTGTSPFVSLKINNNQVIAMHTELLMPDGRRLIFHQGADVQVLKTLLY